MIEIGFSSSFHRAYKKTIKNDPTLKNKFWQRLEIFQENPYNPQLKTHKLSGKLKNLWSFSIDFENRVIFFFLQNNRGKVILVDIGKHDVVY